MQKRIWDILQICYIIGKLWRFFFSFHFRSFLKIVTRFSYFSFFLFKIKWMPSTNGRSIQELQADIKKLLWVMRKTYFENSMKEERKKKKKKQVVTTRRGTNDFYSIFRCYTNRRCIYICRIHMSQRAYYAYNFGRHYRCCNYE